MCIFSTLNFKKTTHIPSHDGLLQHTRAVPRRIGQYFYFYTKPSFNATYTSASTWFFRVTLYARFLNLCATSAHFSQEINVYTITKILSPRRVFHTKQNLSQTCKIGSEASSSQGIKGMSHLITFWDDRCFIL